MCPQHACIRHCNGAYVRLGAWVPGHVCSRLPGGSFPKRRRLTRQTHHVHMRIERAWGSRECPEARARGAWPRPSLGLDASSRYTANIAGVESPAGRRLPRCGRLISLGNLR